MKKRTHAVRPLIGISMRLEPAQHKFYLQTNYSEAVEHAGGTPILVPLIPEKHFLRSMVGRLDGIVLSGSASDIDPRRYGARKMRECGEVHPARDITDFLLLQEAFKKKTPVLAICFGIQSLNVFLGGTLIQDISAQCRGACDHELKKSRNAKSNPENFCSHRVTFAEDSILYRLAGGKSTARVNSSHHQAIERSGKGLKITAVAPDGIIEGVELDSKNHFVLGTQWHPEKGFERDALSLAIFKQFVDETRKKAS